MYTYNNRVNTEDLDKYFSARYGSSLQPFFYLYLRTTQKLEISLKRINDGVYQVKLLNLDIDIPLKIVSENGKETVRIGKKTITRKSNTLPIIDPEMYYLTKIILE